MNCPIEANNSTIISLGLTVKLPKLLTSPRIMLPKVLTTYYMTEINVFRIRFKVVKKVCNKSVELNERK